MFEAIYNFIAIIFGYIMNCFYIFLDFIGLPYLWLCIVLFAITTRLIFLPQKIGSSRKAILSPAINYDIRQLRKKYGTISKTDKEKVDQYKKDSKAIFKKYKVSSGTGCLTTLIQFPVLVGLFRVVKEPFQYVPQLSHLTDVERANVNDFFGLSLEALPQVLGGMGIVIPLAVLITTCIQVLPQFFKKGVKKQPALVIVSIFQVVLLTWVSFCMPIAISIYWVVNNLTNLAINKIIDSALKNDAKIKLILADTVVLVNEEKAREEAEKAEKEKASVEAELSTAEAAVCN